MKKYQFQFSKHAEIIFAGLEYSLQKRIHKKLEFWGKSKNPLQFAKPLRARENTYRFRVGDYRILVVPQENGTLTILVIVKIGHRKEIYQ